jgi:hypothetical protein
VVESLRFSLHINPLYHRLAAAAQAHPHGRVGALNGQNGSAVPDEIPPMDLAFNAATASETDREHIRRYVNR